MKYDTIGNGYARYRVPDHRIVRMISDALTECDSVVNVGAGTGSYELSDRYVVAVEPSTTMIQQRGPSAAPVVQAFAESLPFENSAFDAAMAVLTLHHWSDLERGLREMRRVARKRVVILTWDPSADAFWLTRDYFPEILANDRAIFPSIDTLRSSLGEIDVHVIPVPHDCTDGFLGAYWRRPTAYLDPNIRFSISAFAHLSEVDPNIERLRSDIELGLWSARNN